MPKVDVKNRNRNQGGERDRDREQGGRQAAEGRQEAQGEAGRGSLAPRGLYAPSFFSLSPRELTRTSPFELMRRFTEQLDRVFEGPWGAGTSGDWAPAVEAFERDGKFVVRAELPGLKQDDIQVEVAEGGVIIKGERKSEHEDKGEGFYRSEWSYGQFQRFVPLPYENANVDQAGARFENGVLEVTIPVPEAQASRRRQVPVETAGGEGRPEGRPSESKSRS